MYRRSRVSTCSDFFLDNRILSLGSSPKKEGYFYFICPRLKRESRICWSLDCFMSFVTKIYGLSFFTFWH